MVTSGIKVGDFGEISYWEERYRKEGQEQGEEKGFEWYPGVEEMVTAALADHCKPGSSVLEVGCGTSHMPELLCRRAACQKLESPPTFAVMDACALDCADGSWDVVLDKATLDALDCAGLSSRAVLEIWRVLKPDGFFLLVSCRDPAVRLPLLQPLFHLKDIREFRPPEDRLAPCANAFIYCLRRQERGCDQLPS